MQMKDMSWLDILVLALRLAVAILGAALAVLLDQLAGAPVGSSVAAAGRLFGW